MLADLPGEPAPPPNPETLEPMDPEALMIIAFLHCGHGYVDIGVYQVYFDGDLEHVEHSQEQVDEAMAKLPAV